MLNSYPVVSLPSRNNYWRESHQRGKKKAAHYTGAYICMLLINSQTCYYNNQLVINVLNQAVVLGSITIFFI